MDGTYVIKALADQYGNDELEALDFYFNDERVVRKIISHFKTSIEPMTDQMLEDIVEEITGEEPEAATKSVRFN